METQITAKSNMGAMAYLTVIGLIIAFNANQENRNEFTSFHIRQSLGLAVTGIILCVLAFIPFVGWLISTVGSIGVIILWLTGFMNALNHEKEAVPLLGNIYNHWFQNLSL